MGSESATILMFHRVIPDEPCAFGLPGCYRLRGTAMTELEFRRALDVAGPIIPLSVLEEAIAERRSVPPGAVLTFDDGYREHLDIVTPLLTERGMTGTFYVATGLHGGQHRVGVVDAWYWLLDHAQRPAAACPLPDGTTYDGRVDTIEGKRAWVMGPAKAALLAATGPDQAAMLDCLAEMLGCSPPEDLAARLYMRQDEWAVPAASGMSVGAHSVTHPRLTQLDDVTLADEIGRSVEAIRQVEARVAFAYPDGAYDARIVEAARRAGVSSAVTCVEGTICGGATVLALPRRFVSSIAPFPAEVVSPASPG